MSLQTLNAVGSEDEPQLERPKALAERDLPVLEAEVEGQRLEEGRGGELTIKSIALPVFSCRRYSGSVLKVRCSFVLSFTLCP